MSFGGVGVDILVAHRAWEVAMIAEAAVVPWQGLSLPSLRVEALSAMKLRAGGPQGLVDAARLEALPGLDAAAFERWKTKLRVRA
jgi:hypothetical protein